MKIPAHIKVNVYFVKFDGKIYIDAKEMTRDFESALEVLIEQIER